MTVLAKCHNYTGCLQAYRGDDIEIPDGAPMVCPECGQPVEKIKAPHPRFLQYVPLLVVAVAIGAAVIFGAPLITRSQSKKDTKDPSQTNAAPPVASASTPAAPASPAPIQSQEPPSYSEPPATVTAPPQIDMSLAKAENQKVKEEVLKRIDLMPNVSSANKDKLYNSVERARSMGKVLTIPFGSGKITLGVAEALALKAELEKPAIMKLREDPTAVFVVLGYADPKGDEKKNLALSQARADAVLDAMRDDAGVNNVMHSVAMGGSTIVDDKDLDKNRVVEIWAVLP